MALGLNLASSHIPAALKCLWVPRLAGEEMRSERSSELHRDTQHFGHGRRTEGTGEWVVEGRSM